MASYIQTIGTYNNFGIINSPCTASVRCDTKVDIVKNITTLTFYLLRSGKSYSDYIKYNITTNGEKTKYASAGRTIDSSDEIYLTSQTINHQEDGYFGDVNIEFELFANYSDALFIWTFHESCTLSFTAEKIDRSTPIVEVRGMSADRFGKNAYIKFSYEQFDGLDFSKLSATEAKLIIKELDYFQASNRSAQSLGVDKCSMEYSETVDGIALYNLIATKTNDINQDTIYTFNLDSADSQDIAPLTSGEYYQFEIFVTCENGNTGSAKMIMGIPNRVINFSCEEKIDIILGQAESVDYSITPPNAQMQGVSFFSSDTEIAEINEVGIITPVSEGVCKITVIPDDDGAEPFAHNIAPWGGYYHTPNGVWIPTSEVFSLSTGLIKVWPSDKFIYTGRGGDGAASVIWYDVNRSYISAAEYAGTIAGTEATVELSPPEGAEYVRFQSFGYAAEDLELNAVRYAYYEPFKGECIVTVALTQGFPELPENVQFLTAKLFSKINIAAEFVRDELTAIGATVEEFADSSISGKNHPVRNIREKLEATNANCQKLRTAAESKGFSFDSISEMQPFDKKNNNWFIIINNWILFLNDLHNQINGG